MDARKHGKPSENSPLFIRTTTNIIVNKMLAGEPLSRQDVEEFSRDTIMRIEWLKKRMDNHDLKTETLDQLIKALNASAKTHNLNPVNVPARYPALGRETPATTVSEKAPKSELMQDEDSLQR